MPFLIMGWYKTYLFHKYNSYNITLKEEGAKLTLIAILNVLIFLLAT